MAILGVHAIKDRAGVVGGQVVPRRIMHISLAYDHRFIDGAVAARFAADLIARLENPLLTLAEG